MICCKSGLVGREHFAIDGCKLPSDASKEWSGTHADLKKKSIITSNKRLNKLSLRGQAKVTCQWMMLCMIHNIEKLWRYGNKKEEVSLI
ncbi:transposase [Marinomonas sp. 15G1-11]|uniref:Transposase n=1 Tax=Marinomonas phaeophyticola TaxID=3004091 RepID=A0ABT4JTM0_9GAMM|nr:transposase [Marinomonas sp. 15G1-11]MCZ2721560.1 transposase [Marinomonas sp. 15G1-11]